MAIAAQLTVGIIALLVGTFVSLMLSGGLGPCGTEFSIGWTIVAIVVAIVVSLIPVIAVPTMRPLGAAVFSIPLGVAFLCLAVSHEWLKCLSCLACAIAAFATVYFGTKGLSVKSPHDS
jgi:hypothetical protein